MLTMGANLTRLWNFFLNIYKRNSDVANKLALQDTAIMV
jgi:hypothetical protein